MTKQIRHSILTLILTTIGCALFGQNNDTWTAFRDKNTNLIGFKDPKGIVKIEPKFTGLTCANKFQDIIVVTENTNGEWKSYYLTKKGKIVGRDSLHIFDNGFDCESEGFIRFRDYKTDKVGLFNKDGEIVIPAEYNDLTSVRNGMINAIKDAEKKYMEGDEYYNWEGGREQLIDTKNNVLIDNFRLDNNLNLFSVKISAQPNSDILRKNFKAVDGQYYSFIDFEKEFQFWLRTNLLDNFTKTNLLESTFSNITWASSKSWITEPKQDFIERNYELIKSKLQEIEKPDCDYFISRDELNQYMFESEDFENYYNNCGEPKTWIYPTMTIIISHKDKIDFTQDHFEFLRTDSGYKLLQVTIRKGEIK
jgi:hypothetical protein